MGDDIANNVELMPILKGIIISVIFIGIDSLIIHWGYIGILGIIVGSAYAGFSSNNTTKYALIYGAIVGFVSSFFAFFTVFTIPIFIILGLFGGFVGKVLQANID